jgi:hypothetical protein
MGKRSKVVGSMPIKGTLANGRDAVYGWIRIEQIRGEGCAGEEKN